MKNKHSVLRLFQYEKTAKELKKLGFSNTYSSQLARETGSSPAQVRKDFSLFQISGKKRGGYYIDSLLRQLNDIIDIEENSRIIVVGVGKIGKALIDHITANPEGVHIVAGFDKSVEQKSDKIKTYLIEDLKEFVFKYKIKAAILSVSSESAKEVANLLQESGIKGILNFSSTQLTLDSKKTIVHNFDIRTTIKNLLFHINQYEHNTSYKKVSNPQKVD